MQFNHKALVIGVTPYLISPVSAMLYEAGFQLDVVTTSKKIKYLKISANIFLVNSIENLVSQAIRNITNHYDLIIVSDDITLKRIIDSDIPESEKLKLLPICSSDNINHICSKIELSKTLRNNTINTPDFLVCYSYEHLKSNIQQLGYPTLVKVDYSGGGLGYMSVRVRKTFSI